jgi:hypothetical protein
MNHRPKGGARAKPESKKAIKKRVARNEQKKVPRLNDPIRIVPLDLPTELYRPSAGIAAECTCRRSWKS